jgi:hypothetical protein
VLVVERNPVNEEKYDPHDENINEEELCSETHFVFRPRLRSALRG